MTPLVILLAAALMLLQPLTAAANEDPHVRVSDRLLKMRLEAGVAQSLALKGLVADIEASPVLAFVDCGVQLRSGIGARLNFVTSVNGVRYVRVEVDCALSVRLQVALLAHELQHALEIGRRPDIVDVDSMETYYEDTGYFTYRDGTHKGFETAAAVAMQRRVDDEFSGRVPRPAR